MNISWINQIPYPFHYSKFTLTNQIVIHVQIFSRHLVEKLSWSYFKPSHWVAMLWDEGLTFMIWAAILGLIKIFILGKCRSHLSVHRRRFWTILESECSEKRFLVILWIFLNLRSKNRSIYQFDYHLLCDNKYPLKERLCPHHTFPIIRVIVNELN